MGGERTPSPAPERRVAQEPDADFGLGGAADEGKADAFGPEVERRAHPGLVLRGTRTIGAQQVSDVAAIIACSASGDRAVLLVDQQPVAGAADNPVPSAPAVTGPRGDRRATAQHRHLGHHLRRPGGRSALQQAPVARGGCWRRTFGHVSAFAGPGQRALCQRESIYRRLTDAVASGYINTTMCGKGDGTTDEWVQWHCRMGRFGEPHELAGPVVFLASPATSFVSGVTLPVDGGYLTV